MFFRYLTRIFIIFIIAVLSLSFTASVVLQKYSKEVVLFFLNRKFPGVLFDVGYVDLSLNKYFIDIKNISVKYDKYQMKIDNFTISNVSLFKNQQEADFVIGGVKVISPILQTIGYFNGKLNINILNQSYNFSFIDKEKCIDGKVLNEIVNCVFNLENSKFLLNFKQNKVLDIKLDIVDLNLLKIKQIINIIPDKEVVDVLDKLIIGGVANGNIQIEIDTKNENKVKISGEATLENIALMYHSEYPIVNDIKSKLEIKDNKLVFKSITGKSKDLNIVSGVVVYDVDNDIVQIDTSVSGRIKSIRHFVNREIIEELQKKHIDISKIDGNIGKNYIKVDIPLDKTPNIYNIKLTAENVHARIFKDDLKISSRKIDCDLSSYQISIVSQDSSVENIPCSFDYIHNFVNDDNLLNLTLHLDKFSNKYITFKENEAKLKVKYIGNSNVHKIIGGADLTNADFIIHPAGFHKKSGDFATLILGGDDKLISFDLNTNDHLRIKGHHVLDKVGYGLYEYKFKKNDFFLKSINKSIEIYGKYVDLSDLDILKQISNNSSTNEIKNISIAFDQVELKNNVIVNNMNGALYLNANLEYSGAISGFFDLKGSKLEIFLDNKIILLNSNNAEVLLRGIGINDNFDGGKIDLRIDMSKNTGLLVIKDGFLARTPSITNIVSLVSFPGLLSTVSKSNKIPFRKIDTEFDFTNNRINVKSCDFYSSYFDISCNGYVDLESGKIVVKGAIIPSMYGVNKLVKKFPILRQIFGGDKPGGLLFAPFYIARNFQFP